VKKREVSESPLGRSPPKRRENEGRREERGGSRERDVQSRRERGKEREGSYSREWGGEERGAKERSSRRYESPPPRKRGGLNGVIGSALTDERDRAMLESVQRG
jgi:hypothetical protein